MLKASTMNEGFKAIATMVGCQVPFVFTAGSRIDDEQIEANFTALITHLRLMGLAKPEDTTPRFR